MFLNAFLDWFTLIFTQLYQHHLHLLRLSTYGYTLRIYFLKFSLHTDSIMPLETSQDSGFSIKIEPPGDESFHQDKPVFIEDEILLQRLSFLENKNAVQNLIQSIYIKPMRDLIGKCKHYCTLLKPEEELELLLLAVSCIDLTTLSGDDTSTNVERLCYRAVHPLDNEQLSDYDYVSCGAVCVYPARIANCVKTFQRIGATSRVGIAAVTTGFPSGQFSLKTRLDEIRDAVENSADEIDVVINRAAAIRGDWPLLFEELCEMRKACDIRKVDGHDVNLKVILGSGDLLTCTPNTIYMSTLVAIFAGSNFVETSTGKEAVNTTLSIGYIMMRATLDYYNLTGLKIGIKPAGGIRTYRDALNWIMLVKLVLGSEWLNKKLFRFGASGLLDDIEKRVQKLVKIVNRKP